MKMFFSIQRMMLFISSLCGVALLLACAGNGGGGTTTIPPVVAIAAPQNGETFQVGETVSIQSASADASGITRVELYVDGQLAQTSNVPNPSGTQQYSTTQEWTATTSGAHALMVRAYNLAGLSAERTIAVAVNSSALAPTALAATPVASNPLASPTTAENANETATPHATTPTLSLTGPTDCVANARFLSDKTIPDGTVIPPGQPFVKTWVLRNAGTCAWGTGYTLNFVSGASLSTVNQVPLPSANPGENVEVSVNMQAPTTPGNYRADWSARSPDGTAFGTQISVVINVSLPNPTNRTATPAPLIFKPPFPGDMTVAASWSQNGAFIRATAAEIKSGDEPNGSGIAFVEFFIQKADGSVIASKRENNPPYCYFGEADGDCISVEPGTNQFQWANGKPIQPGWYFVRAVAHTPDERIQVDETPLHITIPLEDSQDFFVDFDAPFSNNISSELEFQASPSGVNVDATTGAGIARVEMFVVDYDGNIVHSRPEQNPRYCAFGGGDNNTPCPVYNFAAHGLKWTNGARVNPTQYVLRVMAFAQDGRIAANDFIIQIDQVE